MDADHHVDPAPLRRLPKTFGRPRVYNDELLYELCERIGNGERLQDICKDERMPSAFTVWHWVTLDPKFEAAYTAALNARAELKLDKMEAIAADGTHDNELDADAEVPTVKPNKEALGRSQLRIDTIKWRLSRELPKRFGEPQPTAAAPEFAAPAQPALPPPTKIDLSAAMDAITRGTAVAAK